MKWMALAMVAALVAGGCASTKSPPAGEHGKGSRATLLDGLKPLAGTWMMAGENGEQQVGVEYRVIADGSVVLETVFPGSRHEMVNTYHMDNGRLIVTHYCAAGNQPRMQCTSHGEGTWTFQLRDITNRESADEEYMGELVLTMQGPDVLKQDWRSFRAGKETQRVRFDLSRKKS